MAAKLKINEIAKDFNVTSKVIVELLSNYNADGQYKSQTALGADEVNYIFDALTQKNEVKSFDSYFATGEERAKKQREATESKQQEMLKQQEMIAKLLEEQKAAMEEKQKPAKKAAPKKAETAEKKAEPKKTTPKKAETTEKKAQPKKAETVEKKTDNKKAEPKKAEPKKAEPKVDTVAQTPKKSKKEDHDSNPIVKTKEIHRVDTRSSNVDLEKYNEKYDTMGSSSKYGSDSIQKKQKIHQKSQMYKKGHRSSKKETEQDKLRRLGMERAKARPIEITVGDEITVTELASRMKKTAAEVVKKLMMLGVMASMNDTIDFDTAEIVATELGAKVNREVVVTIEERIMDAAEDKDEDLKPRNPVVVVMGHVDHGKTSLLDYIRNSSVTSTEAGGITQHIGAYKVNYNGQDITFLDTPGHAAVTSMRQRGAMVTDIAILVVAADDGIMPQTIEAISHAKAAGVQIIVAINKMDKPGTTTDRILQQLTEHELVPEEWGGDIICVPVSAHTGMNMDKLLENVLLIAEMQELRANPDRKASGAVIEARLDKGRGPVATFLVQKGTLHTGDIIVAGTSVGRVRVMLNDKGEKVDVAGPSTPVEITGLDEVPQAGDNFDAVSDERLARELVDQRKTALKEEQFSKYNKVTLDNLFDHLKEGEMKELSLIVKADVQGSVEAVKQSLEKLTNEEVRVKVIHGGVGAINESDVKLAEASNAIIIGFNVRPDAVARNIAEESGVDMRMYRVIYDAIEEIESAIKGMLAPKFREFVIGRIEVRSTFKISSVGTIAGCYVQEGKVTRAAQIRVVRDGIVICEDKIDSLRRFKDDVKEVGTNYECGIGLEKYDDIKEGDIFEAFIIEEYQD